MKAACAALMPPWQTVTTSLSGVTPAASNIALSSSALFQRFDLLLAMDEDNLRDMQAVAPHGFAQRARLFLSYWPDCAHRAVPDPYYGGAAGFESVLDLAENGSRRLFEALSEMRTARA